MLAINPLAEITRWRIGELAIAKSNITFANWPMHEGTGTNFTERYSQTNLSPLAMSGSSTHQWAEEGWFSGSDNSSAGTLYFRDQSEITELDAIGRLDDIPNGSSLIIFDYYSGVLVPASAETLLSYGGSAGSLGRYGISIATDGDVGIFIDDGASASASVEVPVASLTAATRHTIGVLIDISGAATSIFLDNESAAKDTESTSDFVTYPSPTTDKGLTIAASGNSVGVANIFGKNIRDVRMANLWMIKDTGSALASNAQALVQEAYENRGDIMQGLQSL